ncbi:MAG: hypothetical protein AAF501_19870, partial [Pseudomonadota bacterium]
MNGIARRGKKKASPEGDALGVEAGFIQARNLSSSETNLRNEPGLDKSYLVLPENRRLGRWWWGIFASVLGLAIMTGTGGLHADPAHGIAMHGVPALDADFAALPYVNPDAPKGGTLVMGEVGGFDSLHPFVLK